MPDPDSDPAVAVCFVLRVDDHDLGTFTSCDGLGVQVEVQSVEEGGNQFFVYQLPGRLKYDNVKFTRVINGDSQKVAKWFAGMASGVTRTNAQIVAKTAHGDTVAQWGLLGAFPVRWTGPQLSAESTSVATETLELAHHGFMEPAQGGGGAPGGGGAGGGGAGGGGAGGSATDQVRARRAAGGTGGGRP